jgi:hypothetical protein
MAKRATRKLKRAAKAKAHLHSNAIDIADALNDEISFAEGLRLAILGQVGPGRHAGPLDELATTHMDRLQTIADAYEKLRSALGLAPSS